MCKKTNKSRVEECFWSLNTEQTLLSWLIGLECSFWTLCIAAKNHCGLDVNVTNFSYKFITTTVAASFKLRDKMFYLELQFAFLYRKTFTKLQMKFPDGLWLQRGGGNGWWSVGKTEGGVRDLFCFLGYKGNYFWEYKTSGILGTITV